MLGKPAGLGPRALEGGRGVGWGVRRAGDIWRMGKGSCTSCVRSQCHMEGEEGRSRCGGLKRIEKPRSTQVRVKDEEICRNEDKKSNILQA